MAVRSTCSWSIDSQWLEPFVKAFCKNNRLDDILLPRGYVLVFCCWTFWRHVVGESGTVTRSHSVRHQVSLARRAGLENLVNS